MIFCNANPLLCVYDIMLSNTLLFVFLKQYVLVIAIGTSFVRYLKVLKMAKIWGCYSWYQSTSLSELGLDHPTPTLKTIC